MWTLSLLINKSKQFDNYKIKTGGKIYISKNNKDTISVRKGEEIDDKKLKKFLNENLSEVFEDELIIEQFGAGHSNLTYLLKIGDWEGVLRRPPLGPVAPKAHDMEREYTILKHLHPVYSTAPKPYVYSNDRSEERRV